MKLDDPNEDRYDALARRVEALEKAAPAGFTSITRGTFRVASIDGLLVEGQERVTGILVVDGTLQVTGTQTVSGTLVISGGQIINGTFVINGTTTVNGNSTYVGDVNITGILNITGTTNLTGTMNVTGGGQIKVGDLTIAPTVASGTGIAAPVKIVLSTPLTEVQALGVDQSIVAPNLPIATGTGLPAGVLRLGPGGAIQVVVS